MKFQAGFWVFFPLFVHLLGNLFFIFKLVSQFNVRHSREPLQNESKPHGSAAKCSYLAQIFCMSSSPRIFHRLFSCHFPFSNGSQKFQSNPLLTATYCHKLLFFLSNVQNSFSKIDDQLLIGIC